MSNLPDKIEMVEKVGELHLKSYKPAEIARRLGISPAQAKAYVEDYKVLIQRKVEQDPEFMERIGENTIEALERMDSIVAEAWATYETAKDNDMINQQINLLKVCGDLEDKRAKLLQLMGAKVDSGMMARMQRAERVNEIVSRIIKDVVIDCPRCKVEVMTRLAEAFDLMNQAEQAVELRELAPEAEVVDVESEESGEWSEEDQAGMLADVFDSDM